jgi:Metallo-beta-lactamase superfamily
MRQPRFFPATSSLCAGGVGFVTAMMATLAANARTAAAETLGRAVPEVDHLAVRIVTDNIVIQFIQSERRDDLSIERSARADLAPDRPPRAALNGEWGHAMYAESQRGGETRHILVDFGYTPEVLLNNMTILKVDPSCFDALVLSHGHYDHFGGMVGFLNATKGRLKITAHCTGDRFYDLARKALGTRTFETCYALALGFRADLQLLMRRAFLPSQMDLRSTMSLQRPRVGDFPLG